MGIYTKIAGLGFFGVKEPDGGVEESIKEKRLREQAKRAIKSNNGYNSSTLTDRLMDAQEKKRDALHKRRVHLNKVKRARFRPFAHINEAEAAAKYLTPKNIKKDLDSRFKHRPDLFLKQKQDTIEELKKTYGDHPKGKKIIHHLSGANSPKGFANTLIRNLDIVKDIGNSESRKFYNGQNMRSINKLRSFLR